MTSWSVHIYKTNKCTDLHSRYVRSCKITYHLACGPHPGPQQFYIELRTYRDQCIYSFYKYALITMSYVRSGKITMTTISNPAAGLDSNLSDTEGHRGRGEYAAERWPLWVTGGQQRPHSVHNCWRALNRGELDRKTPAWSSRGWLIDVAFTVS